VISAASLSSAPETLAQLCLESGGDQWRRQDLVSRGTTIDAPNAPSGLWCVEGCPLPSRLGGLGERRELPQRGPGGAPVAVAFSAYFRPQNASVSKKNTILLPKKVVVTVITTFKTGGDKSPSSHTKLRLWLLKTVLFQASFVFVSR